VKTVLTVVMVAWWALGEPVGYDSCGNGAAYRTVIVHAMYMISHANVWHLAGNLFVLWLMRGKLYMIPAVVIAFACSFLPSWSLYGGIGVTMGFSGVLFAIGGIKWGVYCRGNAAAYWTFVKKVLPFALLGVLVPHLNWCLHTYCLVSGLLYGRMKAGI
jgi:hypothetical protein